MKMFLFTFSFMVVLFFSFSGTIAVVNACPTITVTNPTQTVYLSGTGTSDNYDAMFTQTGGTEPVTFSLHSGTLPPQFTLFANGRLFSQGYGAGGSITFTVQVTDANNCIGIGPQITLTNDALNDPDLSAMISLRDNCGWGAAFTWSTNSNPCPNTNTDINWNGVTCQIIDGQYRTAIIIAACGGIKLNGTLNTAPYLSTLTALRSLDIRSCYTTQPRAATEFGFLNTFSQLERLRLDNNTGLTGTMADIFPDGFNNSRFPNMILPNGAFYIGNTQISGPLPAGLFTFSAGDFRFQQAQFSGMLPATGSSLPAQLWLNGNKLEGTLPDVIRNAALNKIIYLRYNMLDVENTPSGNIDLIDPLWRTTQTVPPTNVQVVSNSPNSATLNWTPTAYQDHGGYYEVLSATTPGGPYTSRGMTADKTATGLTVTGLPVGTNYFVVRTFTPAHVSTPANELLDNPNNLTSPNSAEVSAIVCSSATLYVDQSIPASGNGDTWATAFKTLDEALLAAHNCPDVTTINVAEGTYKPTKKPYENSTEITTADARDVTFHIPTNVAIYGGYPAGGGTRDINAHTTTLSGDFNGDDVVSGSGSTLSITNNGENAYHVVLASAPTTGGIGVTVDGFTISGGNASVSSSITVNGNAILRNRGGGIYTYYGTNTLSNNTLSGNSADIGGGILTYVGTNTLSNNTLSGNSASDWGGGIYTYYGTNTLSNNTLSGNSAINAGGGIYTDFGTNTLSNNTLIDNLATIGGGILTYGGTNTLSNNTLIDNLATIGGGIYTYYGTNTLSNNTLSGNSATYGGGIFTNSGTNTLSNNTLSGNTANQGGAIYTAGGTNTLSNNTLSGNSANQFGGGIYTFVGTNTIVNNLFWDNKLGGNAATQGADYYREFNSANTFTNNLLQLASSNYTTTGSGFYDLGAGAAGNLFAQDPLFVDATNPAGPDGIHRTADDGLRLQADSPALNAGSNAVIPAGITTDITGAARIQNSTVDIGAYEGAFVPPCPVITTTTITACGSYTWAVNGQTYTQPGTYTVTVSDCLIEVLDLTIPPGQIVSLNGTIDVCVGGVIGLTATGGNQYQWSGPNGFSAVGGSITRTNATVAMSGTYTVTITNNSCTVTLSKVVTVHPIPSAILSGSSTVCSGGSIDLVAPAGAASYQWSGPGGFTQNTGSSNTLTRTNATTLMGGLYRVTVTNAGGCTASGSRNVTVNAPTVATVTGSTSVCGNSTVNLNATTAGVAYQWAGPGGFTSTNAVINAPPVAGTYTVTVTGASGCISTASRTVTVSASPTATISGNTTVCVGGTIYLMASGGNSYAWSGPGGYSMTGTVVNRKPATVAMGGAYTVTVTGNGGCTATASVTVTVATCKLDSQAETPALLNAYPNPVYNETTIVFTTPIADEVSLSVYAIDGREVAALFTGTTVANNINMLTLNTAHYTPGTYFVVLRRASGSTQQMRLVVAR